MNVHDLAGAERVENPFGLEAFRLYSAADVELVQMHLAPGQRVPAHHSPSLTLFYVLGGFVRFDAEGQIRVLHPGQLLAAAAGTAYSMENPEREACRILVIKVPRPTAPVEFVPPSDKRKENS